MGKLCLKCGNIGDGKVCSQCGDLQEGQEFRVLPDIACGTRLHGAVRAAYLFALLNLFVGPCVAGIGVFSWCFMRVSAVEFLGAVLLAPIVVLICFGLTMLAKWQYNPEKYTRKNRKVALSSYKFSLQALLIWFLVIVTGTWLFL